ncbi:ABC transporter substrate-binding protein [Halotalea alkalilenta]|uniref:ABC transporter substrate-binding protein n=1 Tax=Halotalea alkalilenta TaxID=376489 RepID=UPI0005BE0B03|nr:ABC transporter substrate-binding protein [Halotalea alkalilenta]
MTTMPKRMVGAALLGFTLAGMAFSAQAQSATLRLELGWLPSGDKAYVYTAAAQGFYAQEGLEVEINSSRGSNDALTKLAAGSADVALLGMPALMAARVENQLPVKAIMSVHTLQPDALFTYSGSGIDSLAATVGKRVGTSAFTSSNTLWPVMLEHNGVTPDQVTLVKVGPGTLGPMLARGQLDAIINWIPDAPRVAQLLEQTSRELVALPWSDAGLDGYGQVVAAPEALIESHPEQLEGFVRATLRGLEYANAHPDQAAQALVAAVQEADAEVIEAEYRAAIGLIDTPIAQRDGLGALTPGMLAANWRWVSASMDYPTDRLDPDSVVDRRFLPNNVPPVQE